MQQNVCRLCAQATDESQAVNIFEQTPCNWLRQIKLISGILLKYKPHTPSVICNSCRLDLKSAINLRNRCLASEKKWQQCKFYKKGLRRRVHINDNALSTAETLIKIEEQSNAEDDGVDHLDMATSRSENLELGMESDSEALTKKPMRRQKRLQRSKTKKPTRAKESLSVYVCEKCGNNIKGKSTFDRHVRKHANIRPYQCQMCTSRFLSAGELKGHQGVHTGAKNFPCRYCERRYVNYSGRMRHERTHTNERPFVCAQCGKAFTSAYILKNHMLIHTGERLFSCKLCARSFQRTSHLSTHYRSNTHKQNLEKAQLLETQEEVLMAQLPTSTKSINELQVLAMAPQALPLAGELLAATTSYGVSSN